MEIRSFGELNEYLKQFVPGSIMDGDFYNPDKMYTLLPLLGNPQDTFKVVHIAGTSGKTSTCYFVSAMLQTTEAKVGLTVSPHIFEINERVQINGQPLSEADMCDLFNEFINIDGIASAKPTYFELLVCFSLWTFARKGCDYVVLEVGLGGLKDASNVIDDPDKVAVITDIGLDHTRILGDTIEQITIQKAGIIKPHNHVFCYAQSETVDDIIDEHVQKADAILHRFDQLKIQQGTDLKNDLPDYQKRNWLLAREVVTYIAKRDSRTIDEAKVMQTQEVQVPGRMQAIRINDKLVIFDGAHNPQKLRAFVDSLKHLYPNKTFGVLVAFMQSKQATVDESLRILRELSGEVITTQFEGSADLIHAVTPAKDLARQCEAVGFDKVQAIDSSSEAFDELLGRSEDILVITGSFYLISSLREKMLKK